MLDKVRTILNQLNEAQTIEDMRMTSFHLHPLKGDMKGLWSVTVRADWRIVFRFANGDADAVELIDYQQLEKGTANAHEEPAAPRTVRPAQLPAIRLNWSIGRLAARRRDVL